MTAPTLSSFVSELRNRNISRPNLYYVQILPPDDIDVMVTDSRLVSSWCSSASTPQSSISTNDDYIENGIRRKYAYDQDYQNLILNFYIDQDFEIKNFFDQWKNLIVPQRRNFNYPDNYTADRLDLYIINQADHETYQYTYTRVFPKTVQSIELSYASGTAISTFSVEFVFEDVHFTKFTNGVADKDNTSIPPYGILDLSLTNGVENNELLNNIRQGGAASYSVPIVDTTEYVNNFPQTVYDQLGNVIY